MARIDNPSSGFPWDRVKAAKRYLYSVKPWWARFGEKLLIVPTYTPPPEGKHYGAMTSTDISFRLYIDRTFATTAPLHFLAGSLEHEFQHHTRDTWRRLRWLNPDDWREFANIAIDLEINSGIDAEQRNLDLDVIYASLSKSVVFSQRDFKNWNVSAPPGLDDDGWIPRLVEMPEGLSAEEYLRLLQKSREMYDQETLSEETGEDTKRETPELDVQSNSPAESSDTESDKSDGSEAANGKSGDENEDDQPEELGEQEAEGTSDGDTDQSADSDSYSDTGTDPESDIDSEGPANPDAGSGKQDSQDQGVGESANDSDSSQSQDDTNAGQSDSDQAEANANDSTAQGGLGQPSARIAELVQELRKSGNTELWASELENINDPLSEPNWKPEELPSPPDSSEIGEAYKELEEDVSQIGQFAGHGNDPTGHLVKWAMQYRRSRGLNWDSRFLKLVSSAYETAKIKGQSDLSYSVRNPNQQPLGVILQGMHGYSPNIYVLQDISGSMRINDAMAKSMSLFTDVCAKVFGRFGEKITWVTADTIIRDIGQSSSWSDQIKERWSFGFGGTDFGDIMLRIMRGKLKYNGKSYPPADLLIVSSDCMFEWPKIRPKSRCKILVVNVGDPEYVLNYIPDWLNMKREFVQVD